MWKMNFSGYFGVGSEEAELAPYWLEPSDRVRLLLWKAGFYPRIIRGDKTQYLLPQVPLTVQANDCIKPNLGGICK